MAASSPWTSIPRRDSTSSTASSHSAFSFTTPQIAHDTPASKEAHTETHSLRSDSSKTQTQKQRKEFFMSPSRTWNLYRHNPWYLSWQQETWAMGFSICCLVATCIIMAWIDGRRLSIWHWAIQPNAVVSLLLVSSKAALMLSTAACLSQLKWTHFQSKPRKLKDLETFDDASRGPWGSLRLLFARGTGSLDAAVRLGCAITVLVLAMETFGQQLLSFPEKRVAVAGEVASFPTIQNLLAIPSNSGRFEAIPSDRLLQSRLSLMESIYGRTTAAPFECGASECSWGSHVTLGLCSSCRDVSDIQPQCKVKVLVKPSTWVGGDGQNHTVDYNTTTLECQYGGDAYNLNTIRRWNLESVRQTIVPDANNASAWNYSTAIDITTWNTETWYEKGEPAVALNFSALIANDNWERPQITTCTLNYCAWVYENSTAQGQNFNVGSLNKYILGWEDIKRTETGPGSNARESNFTFRANGTGFPSDKHNETFLVYGEADSELSGHLSTILRSASLNNYRTTVDDPPTPGLGEAMLANTNITELADRMATGMTNVWRQYENEQAIGTAWESVAFIHVEWVWLTLPAAAVLGASVVLVMTLIQNRRTVLWKSSVLPYSFRALQGWEDTEFDMETLEEIRGRAKEMTGQLVGDGSERVRLVKS
jgi:hypothetical protein